MEITIAYFWILKLIMFSIIVLSTYKFMKTNSMFYGVLIIIFSILTIINPIKIEQPTTLGLQYNDDIMKQVKPKLKDDSFKESTNIKGITKEDLK